MCPYVLFFRAVFVLLIVRAYTLVWVCVIWRLCGSPCDPALAPLCRFFAGWERGEGKGMLVLFWATGWSGGGASLGCMCNLLQVAERKINSGAASWFWWSWWRRCNTANWILITCSEHNNTGLVCLREQGINILCFVTIALCLLRGQHWSEENLTPLKCIISWQINISIPLPLFCVITKTLGVICMIICSHLQQFAALLKC